MGRSCSRCDWANLGYAQTNETPAVWPAPRGGLHRDRSGVFTFYGSADMTDVLEQLACEVGAHELTLLRASGRGLIHVQRPTSRQLSLSDREISWVRVRWPLVSQLLSALKTESNVELAVLFGSTARSLDVEDGSDVDLVVALLRSRPGALEALSHRLAERLQADIDLVPLGAVLRSPSFLAELLRDGRPVVDREQAWPKLQATCRLTQAKADREGEALRREAVAAVDYFRRMAAERVLTQ